MLNYKIVICCILVAINSSCITRKFNDTSKSANAHEAQQLKCKYNYSINLPSTEQICGLTYAEDIPSIKVGKAICVFGNENKEICNQDLILQEIVKQKILMIGTVREKNKSFSTLFDSELLGIDSYIGNMYKELGKLFRAKPNEQDIALYEPVIKSIISGINKLPPFAGVVYSGVVVAKSEFDSRYNKIFIKPGFFSASTDKNVAERFALVNTPELYYSVVMVVNSKTAKSIQDMSEFPEGEVLYAPYFPFTVEKIESFDDRLTGKTIEKKIVYLQENL